MRAQVPGMHDYLKKFLIEFVFITIFVSQSGLFEATLFESYFKKNFWGKFPYFFAHFCWILAQYCAITSSTTIIIIFMSH